MASNNPYATDSYSAGGIGSSDLPAVVNDGGSISGMIGRFWNNINGNTASNLSSLREAEVNRLFNSAEAKKQREHELYMSNTAYQRAAADMKKAGLNPAALAGFTGAGAAASSSSSSAASSSGGYAARSGRNGNGIIGSLLKVITAIAIMK